MSDAAAKPPPPPPVEPEPPEPVDPGWFGQIPFTPHTGLDSVMPVQLFRHAVREPAEDPRHG